MRRHVRCSGTLEVALPPVQALHLFTPEGERRWVEGWDPTYPAGRPTTPRPGLVFQVGKEAGMSVWIVTRFDPPARGASYAYVLPRRRSALIDVDVEPAGHGGTSLVRVVYSMTALSPEGDRFVHEFEEGYPAFLHDWEETIERLLSREAHPDVP